MSSRSIATLLPEVQELCEKWLAECGHMGIDVLITCTYRSPREQAALYLIGRTPGDKRKIVTNAPAWRSWHNYKRAWDAYPLVGGKIPSYESAKELYDAMGEVATRLGIEWGGRWRRLKDYGHYQVTGGMTFKQAYDDLVRRGYLDEELPEV